MAFIIHLSGPNEALTRSGGGNVPKIRVGGRLFVIPIIHRSFRLSLEVPTRASLYVWEGHSATDSR